MENNNTTQRRGNAPYYNQQGWDGEKRRSVQNQPINNDSRESKGSVAVDSANTQKQVKTFRNLAIWQKGISLAKAIYQKTSAFPKDELYGLVSQARRAAVSIPSNIAEGYRRRHTREFQQFLNVALGSLGELETQMILSGELDYLSNESKSFLLEEIDHLTRMIISLSKKVDR